ncbi:MAG TPA: glycosyltransferase family 4 protein [Chitinophagales bacterium]|nr:glycosyltransferase family 4 protein [Chitinophagales bacterium]
MKKILLLTPTLPFPPHSGGVIKTNKVAHFLSEKYELSIACFLKNDDAIYVDEFLENIDLNYFISETLDIPRTAKNFILSNLQGIPLNLFRNKSSDFRNKINDIIDEYDVVFCDHYVMFQYIPKNYKGKIVLHEHNCEYLIWKRYAGIEKNRIKKIALLNQAWRIKKYEQEICHRADTILAAPNDKDELVKIGANASKFYETYHLGDDELLSFPNLEFNATEKALLYIGTLSWEANIDGLIWFYNQIWNLVKQQHPTIKLFIVGKNPDARLKEIAAKDAQIILTGFVKDVEPCFQECNVFISPLRFGSGIKVKVINALYRGIPCVTTSIGTEGLKTNDGFDIFSKDNPVEFANAIHTLLSNENKWKEISRNARETANKYYTWQAVLENIIRAIEN